MFLVQKLKIIVRKLIPITKRLLFGMDIVSDQEISVLDFTKIAEKSGFFERGDLFMIWSTLYIFTNLLKLSSRCAVSNQQPNCR